MRVIDDEDVEVKDHHGIWYVEKYAMVEAGFPEEEMALDVPVLIHGNEYKLLGEVIFLDEDYPAIWTLEWA